MDAAASGRVPLKQEKTFSSSTIFCLSSYQWAIITREILKIYTYHFKSFNGGVSALHPLLVGYKFWLYLYTSFLIIVLKGRGGVSIIFQDGEVQTLCILSSI